MLSLGLCFSSTGRTRTGFGDGVADRDTGSSLGLRRRDQPSLGIARRLKRRDQPSLGIVRRDQHALIGCCCVLVARCSLGCWHAFIGCWRVLVARFGP